MPARPLRNPRLVLFLWMVALCALFAALVGFNVLMLQYAQAERARDYRTWLATGGEALEVGDFATAREHIATARRLAPGHPEPLVSEGHLYYRLKKWESAVGAYQQAIQLGSPDYGIRQNIVWAHIELGQFAEATRRGREFMAEARRGEQLPRYLAEAYFRMGDLAGAIEFYTLALEQRPGDLYLMDRLARCYAQTNNPGKARELQNQIQELQSGLALNQAAQE